MNKEKLIAAVAEIYQNSGAKLIRIDDEIENIQYDISEGLYPGEIQVDIRKLKIRKLN